MGISRSIMNNRGVFVNLCWSADLRTVAVLETRRRPRDRQSSRLDRFARSEGRSGPQVGENRRALKVAALDLDVPMLVLSQFQAAARIVVINFVSQSSTLSDSLSLQSLAGRRIPLPIDHALSSRHGRMQCTHR
jgi:hypothetical protein